jgi:transcriptional regulator with XRE-family HTH domain
VNNSVRTGRKISMFRRYRNLTQTELAKAVGISRGYLAAIEKGRKEPSIRVLSRIAKVLKIELSELLRHSSP